MAKDIQTKNFVNYRDKEIDPKVAAVISLLNDGGAYYDMNSFRTDKEKLRDAFANVFDADFSLDSRTRKTGILKSHIVRTIVTIYVRSITMPSFDVEPVNKSKNALVDKTKASIVKSLLEWFIRNSGYEDVFNESKEDMCAYGNSYIRPFLVETKDKKRKFPAVEDMRGDDLLIDPNSTYITSESFSKQAQYYAHSRIYPKRNLVARFGEWILDHAQPGYMVDEKRYPLKKNNITDTSPDFPISNSTSSTDSEFYEVLEIQNKSAEEEYILVGGNALPVLRRVQGDKTKTPKEIADNVVWGDEYIYKDSFGRPILTIVGYNMFHDPDASRDWGLAHMLAVPQVMHEMTMNLVADNMQQRLDQIKFIAGGNSAKIDQTLDQYRKQKLVDRYAIWKIPSSLAEKNLPTPGVLKFEGLTAVEGQTVEQQMLDFSKNASGVDPQQQEVQKNTGLGQTETIQEKSTEAIEGIVEANMSNFKAALKTFLCFIIAHKGFGLDDVLINYTMYIDEETETEFKEGNDDASISIVAAAKKIAEFEFDVIIDRSSLIKKSRAQETRDLIELLGLHDPQADPEGWKFLRDKITEVKGFTMPHVETEQIAQMNPQGGSSQFNSGGAAAPQSPAPAGGIGEVPPPAPEAPPVQ